MRVPASDRRPTRGVDSAMTPMIDVVFLLLIFFVWTASFQVVERLLPSELTTTSGAGAAVELSELDFEQIVIRLEQQATELRWTLNQQPVPSLLALRQQLEILAEIRADLPVVVDPDVAVPLGAVIDVYDQVRAAGMANIQFTTRADTALSPADQSP